MKIKKIIAVVSACTILAGSSVISFAGTDYSPWNSQVTYPSDVMGTELLAPVKSLMDRKIITGDTDGLFHPEKSINRAEFATMMAKATNNTSNLAAMEKKNTFSDLDGYTWAKGYINACADVKLIEGVGNSKFMPGKDVTYAEVITVIIRTNDGSDSMASALGTWPDNYIKYATMYNMLGSMTIKDWNAPATKGDVAKLMYRNMPK